MAICSSLMLLDRTETKLRTLNHSSKSMEIATLFPVSLFSASIVVEKKTVVQAGHGALVDKHFPTRVVFSLYVSEMICILSATHYCSP